MANVQERTSSTGIKSYRVGYYDALGKFKYTPTIDNRDGAERIKEIIEEQGYEIALQILDAQTNSDELTLREWFDRHLAMKAIEVTDGTIAEYEREAERTWMPVLGDFPLDTITKDMIIDWVAWQKDQPTDRSQKARKKAMDAGLKGKHLPPVETVKPKTVRNAHSLLSSVLASAVEHDHIPKNVAYGVPLPKDGVEDEKEIFTREEWDRFYAEMTDYYKDFTAVLLAAGVRISELAALRVRDVNPKQRTIVIAQSWKKGRNTKVLGTPKSRRSRRHVMLPDWAIEACVRNTVGKEPDDLVFQSPRGNRVNDNNYRERHWNPALERAGITKHVTPHSARHTFASWALMAGVPPQVVQHRLGHESLATTSEVYGHLLLDAQEAAVDAIQWEPKKQLS